MLSPPIVAKRLLSGLDTQPMIRPSWALIVWTLAAGDGHDLHVAVVAGHHQGLPSGVRPTSPVPTFLSKEKPVAAREHLALLVEVPKADAAVLRPAGTALPLAEKVTACTLRLAVVEVEQLLAGREVVGADLAARSGPLQAKRILPSGDRAISGGGGAGLQGCCWACSRSSSRGARRPRGGSWIVAAAEKRLAVARRTPGDMRAAVAGQVAISTPVARSHSLIVRSVAAVAISLPSGLTATASTAPVCSDTSGTSRLVISQTLMSDRRRSRRGRSRPC